MRRLRLIAFVFGVALLALSAVTAVHAGRDRSHAELDRELSTEVSEQAAALRDAFALARVTSLLTARNPAFAELASRDRRTSPRRIALLELRVAAALTYLQRLHPGRIGEACLLDRHGRELVSVLDGRVAPRSALSADESREAFFGPARALSPGQVYRALPARSPDTGEWVISHATRVPARRPAAGAIVHFEVTLESLRRELAVGGQGLEAQILDARTGMVLLDGRGRPPGSTAGPVRGDALRSLRAVDGRARLVTLAGRRVAYRHLPPDATNANDWYAVVSSREATPWSGVLGAGPISLLAAAVLLLAFVSASVRAHQRELRRAAQTDDLTGLPNRAAFHERLAQATSRRRDGRGAALLIIDLDRFKEVNDTLGHHKGDLLLREVGARLRACVRPQDDIARLGGDEFAVLLPDVHGPVAASSVAARIRDRLRRPFVIDGLGVHVDPSIGIALHPQHGRDADPLIQHADIAMYDAKRAHAGWRVYDPARDPHSARRLGMVADLRAAIDRDELVLHYQPKVELRTGRIVGAEALVRWPHPTLGLLQPDAFISLAEDTGMIEPLTRVVLERALAQCGAWRAAGIELRVSVNLSPRVLADRLLPGEIATLLARFGLPPAALELEITESTIIADPARALDVLARLSEMGVRLSVDDFGTGYSSLAYLRQLPIDELKIDRAFVATMTTEAADASIVRSTIELGHDLGLGVVAEGVEDEPTRAALAALGCDLGQGYHLGRPVPAEDLTALLGTGRAPRVGLEPTTLRLTAECSTD